jgi:hypothetical protein
VEEGFVPVNQDGMCGLSVFNEPSLVFAYVKWNLNLDASILFMLLDKV